MERRLGDPVFTEAMRYVQQADFFGPRLNPETTSGLVVQAVMLG